MNDLVPNLWTALGLTILLGGAGAFMAGRAAARAWRAPGLAAVYVLPLAAAARFLHYALYGESTSALQGALTAAYLAAVALTGYFVTRRRQMAEQYPWLGAA